MVIRDLWRKIWGMDEATINDLKQFIVATVSQATGDLASKDDLLEVKGELEKVKQDITELRGDVKDDLDKVTQDITELRSDVMADLKSFRLEMRHGFDAMDEKLETIANAQAARLVDHERRITRLEHHRAA